MAETGGDSAGLFTKLPPVPPAAAGLPDLVDLNTPRTSDAAESAAQTCALAVPAAQPFHGAVTAPARAALPPQQLSQALRLHAEAASGLPAAAAAAMAAERVSGVADSPERSAAIARALGLSAPLTEAREEDTPPAHQPPPAPRVGLARAGDSVAGDSAGGAADEAAAAMALPGPSSPATSPPAEEEPERLQPRLPEAGEACNSGTIEPRVSRVSAELVGGVDCVEAGRMSAGVAPAQSAPSAVPVGAPRLACWRVHAWHLALHFPDHRAAGAWSRQHCDW